MRTPILFCLPLLCAACATGDARPAGEVRAWRVDSSAVLEIGQAEGDSVYQLYRVRGVAELPTGGVVVANAGSSELRFYDAGGQFFRAVGRSGEGPGEFRMLSDVQVRGDTVYAYDRVAARLSRFLASGTHLGSITLRPGGNTGPFPPALAGVLEEGGCVGWSADMPGERGDGFQRGTALLMRFAADATPDTIGSFPGDEVSVQTEAQGKMTAVMMGSFQFYRTFQAVAAGDRAYAAPTDSAVIHVFGSDGAVLDTLRWDDTPLPLDDAYIQNFVARELERYDDVAARERVRRNIAAAPRPATRPVFDRLLTGPDAELWVRRFADPEAELMEWLVFDREGELSARVMVPRQWDVQAVGRERVYTLERDDYDIEYVRGYPLHR